MPTEGAPYPSGFRISEPERLDRASSVYAVVVSFALESGHFKSSRSDRRSCPISDIGTDGFGRLRWVES